MMTCLRAPRSVTGVRERSALIRDAVELLVRIESGRAARCARRAVILRAEAAPRSRQRAWRVLVDTNIWIDHLRKTEPVLVDLLERDQVCVHQSVITELALGNLKNRSIFLKALERLMIVRNVMIKACGILLRSGTYGAGVSVLLMWHSWQVLS